MANELPNAVALMRNDEFRDWVMAAAVYQARQVIVEATSVQDHAIRVILAEKVALNPAPYVERFVNVIATDPAVAGLGDTPSEIGQSTFLAKIAEVWTPMARLTQ